MTEIPTTSPSSTHRTAILVVVVAFIAGLLIGAAGDRFYLWHHGPRRSSGFASRRIVDRLDSELHLTAQQKTQVQQIIDTHRQRIDGIMGNVRPQIRQEIDASNAEIEKVLTPQQREQFGKMRMHILSPQRHGGRPRPPL